MLTSASASTQTTILPTARTTLSMARFKSAPKKLGDIHPRYLTPATSTLLMGVVSLVWTLFIINISTNVLADSITGLGFQIAFYYGLTGFACTIYYRREIFKSVKNFVMVGVAPFVGGLMLLGIFVKAFSDYNTTSTDGELHRRRVRRRHPGGNRGRPAAAGRGRDDVRAVRLSRRSSSASRRWQIRESSKGPWPARPR